MENRARTVVSSRTTLSILYYRTLTESRWKRDSSDRSSPVWSSLRLTFLSSFGSSLDLPSFFPAKFSKKLWFWHPWSEDGERTEIRQAVAICLASWEWRMHWSCPSKKGSPSKELSLFTGVGTNWLIAFPFEHFYPQKKKEGSPPQNASGAEGHSQIRNPRGHP